MSVNQYETENKGDLVRVIRRIMVDHIGQKNAIMGRDLFYLVGKAFPDMLHVERKVRDTFEPGGELCGKVVSLGHGYFEPKDDKEAAKAMSFLTSYITALSERRKAISDAFPDAAQQDLPMIGGAA
jgi:hypothetical protein